MSPSATRRPEPDQVCLEAVDLARRAAEELAGPAMVGAHQGASAEGERVVMHLFSTLSPGYVGWNWAVTVTRAARAKLVTVSETVLLPGPDALLAPEWVPWTERVRPGDLKAGDLMPARSDDERLVPVVAIVGDDGLVDWDDTSGWGLGLSEVLPDEAGQSRTSTARPDTGQRPTRVLSAIGRDEAADRWHAGEHGPRSTLARAAPGHCQTCGFLVRLSGPLGRVFGVCANEFAPDDGRVVSVDHGCGAHSDAGLAADVAADVPLPAIDELGYDMMSPPGSELPESVLEEMDHELL